MNLVAIPSDWTTLDKTNTGRKMVIPVLYTIGEAEVGFFTPETCPWEFTIPQASAAGVGKEWTVLTLTSLPDHR